MYENFNGFCQELFPTNCLLRSKPKKIKDYCAWLKLLIWKSICSITITSFVVIGISVSEDDNCTSHCHGKNLTCSTELTTLLVEKNSNCANSSKTTWSKDYHPSFNITSHSCEGYEKINNTKACDKVNISSSNIWRICYCLRPSKFFAFCLLHLLVK